MNAVVEPPPLETQPVRLPVVAPRTGAVLPGFQSVPIWHDRGGQYVIRNSNGDFVFENSADVRRDLRGIGYDTRVPVGGTLSPVEEMMRDIQHFKTVGYVGPLAGKRKGVYIEQGRVVLVTEECILPRPLDGGDCKTILAIVHGLLDSGEVNQSVYFYGWLKRAYEALAAGRLDPGQVVAFVGPRNCGKSLLQTLVCYILGGRSANPFAWMTGATLFNSELLRAENLVVGDEVTASPDIRTRRKVAASMKQLTVNETQTCHAKYREPISLRPFWRVTCSLNDEPENLLVLPPLDESVADKIMIFKVKRPEILDTPAWGPSRSDNMAKLVSEVPYFLSHLKSFSIPKHLEDDRFGIVAYQHADVKVALETMTPETRLLELIDEVFWPDDATAGTGDSHFLKASTIERRLIGKDSEVKESARTLLSHWSGATGTYLARLADREDGRVTVKTLHGTKVYKICHPRNPGAPSNIVKIDPKSRLES